jgi:hypothetical protein
LSSQFILEGKNTGVWRSWKASADLSIFRRWR